MSDTPPSSPPDSSLWRHAFSGITFAISLLLGAFAGVWMDKRWSTEPWGVIGGSVLGMVVGFYNLLKELNAPKR